MPPAPSPRPASDLSRLAERLIQPEPLNWVFAGDSITHGVVFTQGYRSYAEHLHELIRGELMRVRDVIVNSAVSGRRLTDILGDFDRCVSSWRPDVVALMIGTNDVASDVPQPVSADQYAASLREFVARVRSLGAVCVLQTPPPVDIAHAPERSRLAEFADVVRDVADTDDIILVDQHARLIELSAGGIPWRLMGDPIHPNAAGHAALAVEMARVLGIRPSPERARTLPMLEGLVNAARVHP